MSEWSTLLNDFHWLRPGWLVALLPLALLYGWLARRRAQDQAWWGACDSHLLPHLLIQHKLRQRPWLMGLLGLSWLLAVLALAGPTWSQRPQPLFTNLYTRLIVLDLSRSMAATDLKPSRLVRARFKVADILAASQDGQVGLVVFAGDAFVVSPITQDADTIAHLLPVLEPSLMPVQGGRVDLALVKAAELLDQANVNQGSVLVVTDQSNGEPALAAARALFERRFSVSVLGVGTPQGAPITNAEGELLKDAAGTIVIPRLEPDRLQQLAQAGGGRYATLSADGSDLAVLLDAAEFSAAPATNPASAQDTPAAGGYWQEQGPWLVLLLLPLSALAFRRGWLVVLALLLPLSAPPPAAADWWDDLWQRRDQQADRALAAGEAARAAKLAPGPWQRGVAAYRAGDYQRAAEAFAHVANAHGDYNRGNALAQLGDYEGALAAYDAALAREPTMADARHNRAQVEKLLKQQQQQEQQSAANDNPYSDQPTPDPSERSAAQQPSSDSAQNNPDQQASSDPSQTNDDARTKSERSEREGNADAQQPTPDERQQSAPPEPATEPDDARDQQLAEHDSTREEEERQMLEQWLRRIPDDPGGLLRRKFLYQYQRRPPPNGPSQNAW